MDERDTRTLRQLADLWDPWYDISYTNGALVPWRAKRRDDGAVFHAREARELHNGISDNYLAGKPPVLSLIQPDN